MDTWWQTETGGFLIAPMPAATPLKPGSATFPLPGVYPKILREDGTECGPDEGGYLVMEKPWPGMMRYLWGDENKKRMKDVYFSSFQDFTFQAMEQKEIKMAIFGSWAELMT